METIFASYQLENFGYNLFYSILFNFFSSIIAPIFIYYFFIFCLICQKNQKTRKLQGTQLCYFRWPGDCSEDQLVALDNFKAFVTNLNDGKLKPEWDEYYLLRYLRARKFNKE